MSFSICDNPDCANQGKAANHPRSITPKKCGKCGEPVRHIYAELKRSTEEMEHIE